MTSRPSEPSSTACAITKRASTSAPRRSSKRSLAEGLHDTHDIAVAQKHLAFIACAYNRPTDCEQAFRAAYVADPNFRLTDAEVGHPLWGPVYKRVAAEQLPKLPPAAATK